MSPSHSSGAGYTPPDPILNDRVMAELESQAQAAQNSQEAWRAGASVLALAAIGGLTAYNPALGLTAAPLISKLEGFMLSGDLDTADREEFAKLISEIRNVLSSVKGGSAS